MIAGVFIEDGDVQPLNHHGIDSVPHEYNVRSQREELASRHAGLKIIVKEAYYPELKSSQ